MGTGSKSTDNLRGDRRGGRQAGLGLRCIRSTHGLRGGNRAAGFSVLSLMGRCEDDGAWSAQAAGDVATFSRYTPLCFVSGTINVMVAGGRSRTYVATEQ